MIFSIMSIVAPLCIDFLRALFVRYVNRNWCWDMEKTFPQYGDFKIAENILTLINNQGQVWMGIFFSPGLVLVNLVKLVIMMYFRSWIVLTCNVPHEVVFKASKSNNFYLALLLTMLFLCVLPVGYAVVWLRPSWHCGPFSEYSRISEFITNTTRDALPKQLHDPLNYLTSSSTVIPLLLLLILIIYYLVSLTGALREANQDLRTQLQKEREEERKKIFKVQEEKTSGATAATLTNRWRKVLEASSPVTPVQTPDFESEEYKNQARKELISRIMKKALRKSSASDEDTFVRQGDDDTDTEHNDSLPHDEEGKEKHFGLSKLQQIRKNRKPSLADIVTIAKSEMEKEKYLQQQQTANISKETLPRGRFRVEKLDRKEDNDMDKERDKGKVATREKIRYEETAKTKVRENTQDVADKSDDSEIKIKIINERRQSLMRKIKENETKIKEKEKDSKEEAEKYGGQDYDKDKCESKEIEKYNDKNNEKLKGMGRHAAFSPSEYKKRIHESIKRQKRDDKEKISTEKPADQDSAKTASVESDNTSLHKAKNSIKRLSFRRRDKSPVAKADEPKENDSNGQSSFKVVDEKNSNSFPKDEDSPPNMDHFHKLSGKFKFKRHKNKLTSEPDVFKFEVGKITPDKTIDIATTPTEQHFEADLQSPTSTEEATTPSLNHVNLGADKFASLSRQGRKKIGSFLALVKDAVNTKMFDQELQRDDMAAQVPQTTIDIPPTPERELPSSAANVTFIPPTTTASSNASSIEPYIMPKAPLETPEDLEPPSYQNYMDIENDVSNPLGNTEDFDQPGPILFPQSCIIQRRRPTASRQDSTASMWSDNIPTITISSSPDGEDKASNQNNDESSSPLVRIVKINLENDQ